MTALFAAQTFAQGPVEDYEFAGLVVVQQVARMGITVKDCIRCRGEKGHGDQSFHQLLGHLLATCGRQAGGRAGHFNSGFLRERGDRWRAQRPN